MLVPPPVSVSLLTSALAMAASDVSVPMRQLDAADGISIASTWAVGMGALMWWDATVVPELKRRSILPDIPLVPGQLTEREKAQPWLTPLTMSRDVYIPTLDRLRTEHPYYIGDRDGVRQYMTAHDVDSCKKIPGVQEVSEEWSKLYGGTPVVVFKKQKWS